MMKKLIYLFSLFCILATACNEDELTQSMLDQAPDCNIPDMSRQLIAEYKNQHDITIIYRFDDVADFRFAFNDKVDLGGWKLITMKQLPDTLVNYGLEMLDSLVLKYFRDKVEFQGETLTNNFKTACFPRRIFVVDSIAGNYNSIGQFVEELNDYETNKYYTVLWNGYEPAFAFDSVLLTKAGASKMNKYRNSALYCFISKLFLDREIYDEFPAAFFEPVLGLYGKEIKEMARDEDVKVTTVPGPRPTYYYDPIWYASKGFAMTNKSPNITRIFGAETKYEKLLDTTAKTLNFPTRERDFRDMLHIVICETKVANIRTYFKNEVFAQRMAILIEELYKRGIDVYAINPAMKDFFND